MNTREFILKSTTGVLALLAQTGCGKIDTFLGQIDEIITQIENAIFVLSTRAGEFNKVLKDLPEVLRQNAGELLNHEIDKEISGAAGHLQVVTFAAIDYATKRILTNLQALAEGLKAERERIKNGGITGGTLENLIRKVADSIKSQITAEVTQGSPEDINISLRHEGKPELKQPSDEIIKFFGWGFKNEKLKFVGNLLDEANTLVSRIHEADINVLSNYIITIRLEIEKMKVRDLKRVRRFELRGDDKVLAQLAVVVREEERPPEPVPKEYTVRLNRLYANVGDGKLWGATETDPTLLISIDGNKEITKFKGHVEKGKSAKIDEIIKFRSHVTIRLIERDSPDGDDVYPVVILRPESLANGKVQFKDKHFVLTFEHLPLR